MMVNGRHPEDARPLESRKYPTWKMTETASRTKIPPTMARSKFLFRHDGQCPQGASQGEGPHVPMNTWAGKC